MAVTLKIFVGNLFSEFLAHTHIILCLFNTAWTISAFFLQSFSDCLNNLFVFVKSYFQFKHPLLILLHLRRFIFFNYISVKFHSIVNSACAYLIKRLKNTENVGKALALKFIIIPKHCFNTLALQKLISF